MVIDLIRLDTEAHMVSLTRYVEGIVLICQIWHRLEEFSDWNSPSANWNSLSANKAQRSSMRPKIIDVENVITH